MLSCLANHVIYPLLAQFRRKYFGNAGQIEVSFKVLHRSILKTGLIIFLISRARSGQYRRWSPPRESSSPEKQKTSSAMIPPSLHASSTQLAAPPTLPHRTDGSYFKPKNNSYFTRNHKVVLLEICSFQSNLAKRPHLFGTLQLSV